MQVVVVVMPTPLILKVMVAVFPSYEFPKPELKVIMNVDVNDVPGLRTDGNEP